MPCCELHRNQQRAYGRDQLATVPQCVKTHYGHRSIVLAEERGVSTHIVYSDTSVKQRVLSPPSHPCRTGPGRHGNGVVSPVRCLMST